jgi:FAD/FMN-containing dehydrogenase
MPPTVGSVAWKALARAIEGDVLRPGEPGSTPPNARFAGARPCAVVRCRGTGDVAETVSFAGHAGLRISVRSGGHCFAGRSSAGELVLDR